MFLTFVLFTQPTKLSLMKIIEVENISKKYYLRASPRKNTLRDLVLGTFDFLKPQNKKRKTLWALKDVSFDVEAGETVGLIGNNGAGKSTLLKILSRIVKPTKGEATLRGRTGSLLERCDFGNDARRDRKEI